MRFGPIGRHPLDMPMRADGKGREMREQRRRVAFEQEMREAEVNRQREASRVNVAAPILRSIADIRAVAEHGPEHPIYIIQRHEVTTIRAIGNTVFGEGGYNRYKKEQADRDMGPHFDAYAGHFSPWTIHRNIGGIGRVRAGFLPEDVWQDYVRDTNGLTNLHADEQRTRFRLGKQYFDKGEQLTTAKIGDGTLTLIWHGSLERPDLPPPSVHEFVRYPTMHVAGSAVKQSHFEIFARQNIPGNFEGFSEV